MATHSSLLAWRIPWAEEPGGLQSMREQSNVALARLWFVLSTSRLIMFVYLFNRIFCWTHLVVQRLGICLLMRGTRIGPLVWEDPVCWGAAVPRAGAPEPTPPLSPRSPHPAAAGQPLLAAAERSHLWECREAILFTFVFKGGIMTPRLTRSERFGRPGYLD